MTLKQLEYFLAIADTGNMTQAAKNLNISQPPLSLQLKALEEELGIALFERDKKSLIITKKGKLLQERTRQILSMVNDTVYDLQTMDLDFRVIIRIGTISSVCNRLLPDKIRDFSNIFPHIEFQIFEGSTTRILEQMANKAVDIGLVREPFNTAIYNYIPITDKALGDSQYDDFCTIAKLEFYDKPGAITISLIELKGKPLIVHRRYNDMLVNACRQRGFAPHVICQNNDIASSLSWAAAGIGIAIAPYTSVIANPNPDMIIKPIIQPRLSSRSYVVWEKEQKLSHEIRSFIKLFEE